MFPYCETWVRIFDIPEVSQHKKGFTLYKIVSMLYPENCPDAVTKITVWKRFNEFKRLHTELKSLHNKLNIKEIYPTLPRSTYFKRFDNETLEIRRVGILRFLEYIGNHTQLFTSTIFVKFFESSHTPSQNDGNISLIRANLNLPEGPEYFASTSDDDRTISDTDSVTTTSSWALNNNQEVMGVSHSSLHSKYPDSLSVSSADVVNPGVEEVPQYVTDASIHVDIAVELEQDRKYEDAFKAYKTAIDIFLKYVKDDKNYTRRQNIRYKIEKYLIRAEKIYNMHLVTEMKNLSVPENEACQEISVQSRINTNVPLQRPVSDLYKYKVIKAVGTGMLALHLDLQQLFYIKVINKTKKFLNDKLILPENVPYMVKLCNYYNCDNTLFLVLSYCSGKTLRDYVKYRSENLDSTSHSIQHLKTPQPEHSDAESETSFSELLTDYMNNKRQNQEETEKRSLDGSDESYEIITGAEFSNDNLIDEAIPFREQRQLRERSGASAVRRKISEISCMDEFEIINKKNLIAVEEVKKWSAQLILALEKLHVLGVVCCILQTKNILIDDNGDLQLTYMCNINEFKDLFNGETTIFLPEVYRFEPITPAVDWWGFGCLLYELLVGIGLSEIYPDGFLQGMYLKIPSFVSAEGRSLLKQLLVFDPQQRLGYGENGVQNLKSHPFFQEVDWTKL